MTYIETVINRRRRSMLPADKENLEPLWVSGSRSAVKPVNLCLYALYSSSRLRDGASLSYRQVASKCPTARLLCSVASHAAITLSSRRLDKNRGSQRSSNSTDYVNYCGILSAAI